MLGVGFTLHAQSFYGEAQYLVKKQLSFDQFRKDMPAHVKKKIRDRFKSLETQQFVLKFDTKNSIYEPIQQLEEGQVSQRKMRMKSVMGGVLLEAHSKNLTSKEQFKQVEFYGKRFLVSESLRSYDWKVTQESKQIGNYLCLKEQWQWSLFFHPSKKNEEQVNQNLVTAWFTFQIPVNHGPDNYWGLPGLVLMVQSAKQLIVCEKISIQNTNKQKLKDLHKGKNFSK